MTEEVLLTGYPSFLARNLCNELLGDPNVRVHALIRPAAKEIAKREIESMPPDRRMRIVPLEGDVSHIDMGLSKFELDDLSSAVERVYHFADVSFPAVERERAIQTNVGGTKEVLEVAALLSKVKSIVIGSTAFVSGNRRGLVREEELLEGQSFRNPVEESKAKAERFAREAMKRLPITVVRPSMVIGHSESGAVDRLDGPYLLFLLMMSSPGDLALPLPAKGDVPLHLVPVDYVARAVRAISLDPRAPGRTVHIVDGSPLTARKVSELVAEVAGKRFPRRFIPANLTKAILMTPGLDKMLKSPRAFLDSLVLPVEFDAFNLRDLLGPNDCPPFPTYVDKIVGHIQTRLHKSERTSEFDSDPLDSGL